MDRYLTLHSADIELPMCWQHLLYDVYIVVFGFLAFIVGKTSMAAGAAKTGRDDSDDGRRLLKKARYFERLDWYLFATWSRSFFCRALEVPSLEEYNTIMKTESLLDKDNTDLNGAICMRYVLVIRTYDPDCVCNSMKSGELERLMPGNFLWSHEGSVDMLPILKISVHIVGDPLSILPRRECNIIYVWGVGYCHGYANKRLQTHKKLFQLSNFVAAANVSIATVQRAYTYTRVEISAGMSIWSGKISGMLFDWIDSGRTLASTPMANL